MNMMKLALICIWFPFLDLDYITKLTITNYKACKIILMYSTCVFFSLLFQANISRKPSLSKDSYLFLCNFFFTIVDINVNEITELQMLI
jgi:hypothetical protein